MYARFSPMKENEFLILSLETATRGGSIALLRGEKILASLRLDEKSSQSVELLENIQTILRQSNVDLKEIKLLAASLGPGSFTGLRIGLAIAKGLSKALEIPAQGIPTLEAIVFGAGQKGINSVVFPVGRYEAFVQTFETNDEINALEPIRNVGLENLFSETQTPHRTRLIAPNEILRDAEKKEINFSSYAEIPSNLAIYSGRLAFLNFKKGKNIEPQLNPIYARGAGVGQRKNE